MKDKMKKKKKKWKEWKEKSTGKEKDKRNIDQF